MTRLICAISRSMKPMTPVRTSRDPARNCTKDVARQLAAQAPSHVFVGDLLSQLSVEVADLSREQDEMQKHIGMHDQENERAEPEEAEQRQVHIEERQLDGALQEKIAMGDAANGDEKVEQDKEIAEPQSRADTGCINHGVAQRLEILCRASEGHCRRRKWRRLAGGGSSVTYGGIWRCRWSRVLRLAHHTHPPSGSLRRESGNTKGKTPPPRPNQTAAFIGTRVSRRVAIGRLYCRSYRVA